MLREDFLGLAMNGGNVPAVRLFVRGAANGRSEPRAVGLKSRPLLMQQKDRPRGPDGNAALQPCKRPFDVDAAKSGGPMTELRDEAGVR